MVPDVILIVLGWVLLTLTCGAVWRYVCGDCFRWGRARARRCPKCWYDMSHTPGPTCSECGATARRESQLHRTRRRWCWAALAALMAVTCWLAFKGPAIKKRGWFAAVPTTAFIFFFEHLEVSAGSGTTMVLLGRPPVVAANSGPSGPSAWKTAGGEEVLNVRFAQSMWSWQRWLFLYRASKVVDPLGASRTNRLMGKTIVRSGLAAFTPGLTSVAEELLYHETGAEWSGNQTPSSHALRVWNRIVDDVVVTSVHGPVGPKVSIDVQDSLWIHAQSKWRAILIWVEGSDEPCLAALVSPVDAGRWQIQDFEPALVSYPPDGVLRLRVQLTEPHPPRTDVALAEHTVLWETHIERHVQFAP